MNRHTVKIGYQSFYLIDDNQFEAIKRAASEKLREGGGIIELRRDDQSSASALISPGVPVFFYSDAIYDDPDATSHGQQGDVGNDFADFIEFGF